MRKLKLYETTHAPNQFTSTDTLPAAPFMCNGNISDMINQGTAPIPIENDAMNIRTPETARSGTHSRKIAWLLKKNEVPARKQPRNVPDEDTLIKGEQKQLVYIFSQDTLFMLTFWKSRDIPEGELFFLTCPLIPHRASLQESVFNNESVNET